MKPLTVGIKVPEHLALYTHFEEVAKEPIADPQGAS
jgi:hypothetical protein